MVCGVLPLSDAVGSSYFVPPSSGASFSFGRGGMCLRWKVLYAALISLRPGTVRPAFVAHVRKNPWKMRRAGHCGSERNGACSAPQWAITLICLGEMYTMVMVAPTRRRVSNSPAECQWMSVCVATSGPC